MRLAPLARRSVSVLAATALLTTGAAGVLAAPALAADGLTVSPSFARNTNAGTDTLTLTSPSASFTPGETVTLTLHSDASQKLTSTQTQVSPTKPTTQTVVFDLRQAAPGAYDAAVTDASATTPALTCSSCFTVVGFQPTVTGVARKSGDVTSAGFFTVSGSNFAKGLRVTFLQAGVPDPAVVFTAAPASADPTSPTSGDPNNPNGLNPTANQVIGSIAVSRSGTSVAKGGVYDVAVTNTDGKVGTCTGCLSIPRIDEVHRSDQAVGTPAQLGFGVTGRDLVVTGAGITSRTKIAVYPTGNVAGTSRVKVNSLTPAPDGKSAVVNVDVVDPSSPTATTPTSPALYDITLYDPEGGYENAAKTLTLNPRPAFDDAGYPVEQLNPGQASKAVPLNLVGSSFQPGMTASFSPSTGITVNSVTVGTGGLSAVVSIDIAADAPKTARAITLTNPDFGNNTGQSTGSITPSSAPVVSGSSPTSVATAATPSTVGLTLTGSGMSNQVIGSKTATPRATTEYVPPAFVFEDPSITAGAVTVSTDSTGTRTGASATAQVTIPANAAPGPRRVFYRDKNFSLVECLTASGQPCFTIDSLGVNAPTPSMTTNDGVKPLTITGSGFALGAVPKLERSGQPDVVGRNVNVVNSTTLTADFDLTFVAPSGPAWSVRVNNPNNSGTGTSRNSLTIVGNQPTLDALAPVTPSSASAGNPMKTVTLKGANLSRGGVLSFAVCTAPTVCPKVVSSSFVDGSTYSFVLDTTGATTGAKNLTFTNTDGTSATCNACFTVNPAPAFSSANQLSPSSRDAGAPTVDVAVNGSGFSGTPKVAFSGTGVTAGTAKSVAAAGTSFVVPVTVDGAAELTARTVTVTNGDGSVITCSSCFTVLAAPTVTGISPSAALRGTGTTSGNPTTVTVTGTGFATNGVGLDLGPGVTVTGATATSATAITASISVSATAVPRGYRDVKVTNTATSDGATSAPLVAGFGIGDVPLAPTGLTAVRSDRAASLSWSLPADPKDATDGRNLPNTSYVATVTKTADGSAVTTATISYQGTTALVTGLANGTSYTFVVKALNAVGTSPASSSAKATPATTPTAPTAVTATAGDTTASVAFTAPTDNGGDPVVGYTVTSSPDGLTASGPTSPITVPGLTNGTSYTFTVTAQNGVGPSVPSAASNAVTPLGAKPGAPTALAADPSAKAGQVVLTWTAPTAATLSPLTSYRVTVDPAAGTVAYPSDRSTTGAVVTGLANGTPYTFTVYASTAGPSAPNGGEGPASTPASATPYDVPGAPTSVKGGQSDSSATITWLAPASNGGRQVTSYTVSLSPGTATQTVTGTTATFDGLSNGTSYTASVVATNLRGNGPAGTSPAFTPATRPGAPTAVSATAAPASAKVTWTAPASNGGSALTGYTVTASPGGKTVQAGGTATSATVTGLSNDTSYTFTVVARNAVGDSPASAASNAVTPQADVRPGAPTGVSVVPGDRQAVVSFTAPAANGGSDVTGYTVFATPDSGPPVTATGSASPITVPGLTNGTSYTVTVSATNGAGVGTASSPTAAFRPMGSSTLTFAALPAVVDHAGAIVVRGTVSRTDTGAPVRGNVLVRARDDRGVVTYLGVVAVNADGSYSRTFTGYVNRTYFVQYAGDTHVNRSGFPAGHRTRVRVGITSSHPATSAASTSYAVTGSVTPNKVGTTITLYRVNSSGSVTTLGHASINQQGGYTIKITLARGSYSLRLTVPETTGNAYKSLFFTAKRT